MEITTEILPLIEKALGIKLYENQRSYLTGDPYNFAARGSGKTLAYCIKLALSKGEPLDTRKPEEFCDEWFRTKTEQKRYANNFFRNEFMRIRDQLKDYGFPVREVRK